MRTILSIVATAALLSSCQPAAQGDAAEVDEPAATTPTGTTGTQGSPVDPTVYADGEARWMLSEDGNEQFLAFAVPETDDVRLLISCRNQGRTLRLWREYGEADEPTFQLSSGDVRTSYPGEMNPEGMAPQLEGVAPARAPVFVAFSATGELVMTVGGETRDLSAGPGALPMVAAFFDHCSPSPPS